MKHTVQIEIGDPTPLHEIENLEKWARGEEQRVEYLRGEAAQRIAEAATCEMRAHAYRIAAEKLKELVTPGSLSLVTVNGKLTVVDKCAKGGG